MEDCGEAGVEEAHPYFLKGQGCGRVGEAVPHLPLAVVA